MGSTSSSEEMRREKTSPFPVIKRENRMQNRLAATAAATASTHTHTQRQRHSAEAGTGSGSSKRSSPVPLAFPFPFIHSHTHRVTHNHTLCMPFLSPVAPLSLSLYPHPAPENCYNKHNIRTGDSGVSAFPPTLFCSSSVKHCFQTTMAREDDCSGRWEIGRATLEESRGSEEER